MTPDRATRWKRRRIRLAIRRTSALAAAIAFFFAWGTIGAIEMTFAQVWTIAKNIALEAFTPVIQAIGSGAQWIYDNWSTIALIFWGLASAALAYAVALGIQTAATWIADGAAKAFFTTLLTNPLFWIALAVGVVVAALYRMIQAVGGVKNAWEICKAALVVAWAALKVAFFATYNWIANLVDKLKLCWQRAGVAIAGYTGKRVMIFRE